jgi:serine/threonine protein phosphatase PrpC
LTRDHSVVEELANKGFINEVDVNVHPLKNTLISAIIGDGYSSNMQIYTKKTPIFNGDIFLICSDGLWSEFLVDELEELFSFESLDMVDSKLFESILTKPLKDNVTYLLIRVDEI